MLTVDDHPLLAHAAFTTELPAALTSLVQAEFLYETDLYPEQEFAFKHPLTQQVAYESQLRERRASSMRRTEPDTIWIPPPPPDTVIVTIATAVAPPPVGEETNLQGSVERILASIGP